MQHEFGVQRAAAWNGHHLRVADVVGKVGLQRVAARREILEGEASIAVGRQFAMRFQTIDGHVYPEQGACLDVFHGAGHSARAAACGGNQARGDHFELHTSTFELRHRPTARRCARTSGRPAPMILACAADTSYSTRASDSVLADASSIPYAARGSPSRGCPTAPQLMRKREPPSRGM